MPLMRGLAGLLVAALMCVTCIAQTIDAKWKLVVGSDPVERTAAVDLQTLLFKRYGVALPDPVSADRFAGQGPAIIVGTASDNPLIGAEGKRKSFTLDASEPESYHLAARDARLYIVGASPKGAMNGVYRFDDKRTLDVASLDEHVSPAFHFRVGGHKMNQHPPAWWSDEDQARYYAQHYINVVWGEKQGPPLPLNIRQKYGLGLMVELRFPPVGQQWLDDPANKSAVYNLSAKRNWRVVSPFDPAGRAAYAQGYRKLLEQNPDTRILYAVFADYNAIPDENSVRVGDGQAFGHTRPEAMKEILGIMKAVIGERDILPVAWLWHGFFGHDQDEQQFMQEVASLGYGALYNEAGNKDDWIIRRDNFNATAVKTGPDGKTDYGSGYVPLVSAGGACESVNPVIGFPVPQVAGTKIRRLADLGVRHFAIWWAGYEGWVYQPNNEIVSEMIWNPRAFDPKNPTPFGPAKGEALIRHVAARDFGPAASDVLEFWRLFDHAVITTTDLYQPIEKQLPPDRDGLHINDWYQRMGTFTEAIFGGGYPVPLTPADLAARKDSQKASWRTNPLAIENYRVVLANLDPAIQQISKTAARNDLPADVSRRLRDMRDWSDLYRHLLTTQYNYIRGVAVAFAHLGEPADSEDIRRDLTPVTLDEIRNCKEMIDLLPSFEPNMNIRSNMELVWQDVLNVKLETAALQQKIAAMDIWLENRANLAKGAKAASSSDENEQLAPANATDGNPSTRWGSKYSDDQWLVIDMGAVRTIDTIVIRWNPAYPKLYELQTATDPVGPWSTVFSTDEGKGAVDVIALPAPADARLIRFVGKKRATGWGYSIEELEAYGPVK